MVTLCLKAQRRTWERIMAEASASGSGLSWVRTSQRPPLLSRRISSDSFWKHSRVASVIIRPSVIACPPRRPTMRHVRTSFLTAVCGFVLAMPILAQSGPMEQALNQALAAIRPQAIRAHMRFLADDLLEGRGTATRGYDIAARYVAARFEELGLEPAGTPPDTPSGTGGSYFQTVPMLQMTTVDAECSLTLLRDGREIELEYGPDFLVRSA